MTPARDRRELWDIEVADWTDKELQRELRSSYEPSVIPPCRVCGAPLECQAVGGGKPTVWACSGRDAEGRYLPGRKPADGHYSDSRYEDRRQGGDERVMEALRRWDKEADHG